MAPAGISGGRRRQFDVACGVLSRCVKAEDGATAGKAMAVSAAPTTMLLMPGADVAPDVREAATQLAPLTIMYGDRVMVFDDFPSYRVAELVLVAERPGDLPGAAGGATTTTAADDIVQAVARKGSLQRFMEKQRDRLVARAPYAAGAAPAASSSNKRNQQGEQGAAGSSSWLVLGVTGGSGC